jgi:hypothetical protein
VNSIKVSVVIAYSVLAMWPGISAHAAPAVISTPVEAVGDIAKWNKLNRRLFEAMVNAGTVIPEGAWFEPGDAMWYTEMGGSFLQKTLAATPAGPSEIITKTVTLDPAKGTITEVFGPVTRVRRVTSEQAHVFTVETLSVSGPDSEGFSTPTLNVRVTPEVIEVWEVSGKQLAKFFWTSRSEALEAVATALGAQSGAEIAGGAVMSRPAQTQSTDVVAAVAVAHEEMLREQANVSALRDKIRQEEDKIRQEQELQRRIEAQDAQDAQVAEYESDREAAHAEWQAEARQREQDLEDSLQRLRDSTAKYEALASGGGNQTPGSDATGKGQNVPGTSAAAASSRDSSAPNASALPAASQGASAGRTFVEGKPLRFVMAIGLDARAGDSVNPTCYSSVVTRAGPPGWDGGGFLPDGSGEQAHATVQSLKSSFIAACRSASGRNVTNENNFRWGWNETPDSEERLNKMRAGNPEDVTVNVN